MSEFEMGPNHKEEPPEIDQEIIDEIEIALENAGDNITEEGALRAYDPMLERGYKFLLMKC